MVQTQCAGYVINSRKPLIILWQGALSWPKLNTYTDMTKPPHTYTGTCKELNINVEEKWYEHEPQTVTERDNITILWDMPIQTDREIKANRPDIVIKDKQGKSCLLIDMSIPTEKNTSVKVTEKLSKYKDLEIEIERMWGMKATTIPVVIGALGLIKKGLEKYTKKIPGNIKISELQKIALLGTSRILRKTLFIK